MGPRLDVDSIDLVSRYHLHSSIQQLEREGDALLTSIHVNRAGWGALCVAGGGAYYFAKTSINADRASRYEAELKKKAQLAAIEAEHRRQSQPTKAPSENPNLQRANMARFQSATDDVASPSAEAGHDPAPTRHEPETEAERVLEKGKYEAAQPFRPPRGNRLG
ncbi:hypothetical protein CDV55_105251 [Aspergillus turcosus]|uniref:Uncharacterized protein n=1 Tax=Aspergillus turcosus TaxID=1245748 RepID=A0A397I350_9EURO|nr:hypothetical protein CDV55_105251 [Aspergillus turcosus]RLL99316.1 hypothetical protein CFD26_106695 [Aspergillus turcosus]